MNRKLLIAVMAVCVVTGPSLAFSQAQSAGSFTAYDEGWRSSGPTEHKLTVKPGDSVTFSYPTGQEAHNVLWEGAKPNCSGVSFSFCWIMGSLNASQPRYCQPS